jgi:hypothetical protein
MKVFWSVLGYTAPIVLVGGCVMMPIFQHIHLDGYYCRRPSPLNSCRANLRQLDSAKEQYFADHKLSKDDSVTLKDLCPEYIKTAPKCPEGGRYSISALGKNPTCSIALHTIVIQSPVSPEPPRDKTRDSPLAGLSVP